MAFAVFGPGSLYITRTDIVGATPINVGFAQSLSLDEAGDTKQLYGEKQYALAAARGTIKATGKFVSAELSGLALNAAFHGDVFTTGQTKMARGESHIIPSAVTINTSGDTPSGSVLPFTSTTGVVAGMSVSGTHIAAGTFVLSFVTNTSVTLTQAITGDVASAAPIVFGPSFAVTNAATFDKDLGVILATDGTIFQYSATSPAAGQYAVTSTGEYSFNTTDSGKSVLVTYAWTTTGGQTLIVTNKPIGTATNFQLDYATQLEGITYYVRIFKCLGSKLSQSFKLTDFMMPEVDIDIFANAADQVYQASYGDVG